MVRQTGCQRSPHHIHANRRKTDDNNQDGRRGSHHHVEPEAPSCRDQQLAPKPWWRRRSMRTWCAGRWRGRGGGSSVSSTSSSSVAPRLFSALFVTPLEFSRDLSVWSKALGRRRRRRREGSKPHELKHPRQSLRGDSLNMLIASATFPGAAACGGREKRQAEENCEKIARALGTARLLNASLQRSSAACVDLRSTSGALVKQCYAIVAWIGPILPHITTHSHSVFQGTAVEKSH